jgi:hypothetical protein
MGFLNISKICALVHEYNIILLAKNRQNKIARQTGPRWRFVEAINQAGQESRYNSHQTQRPTHPGQPPKPHWKDTMGVF